jgi:hypothetical protein
MTKNLPQLPMPLQREKAAGPTDIQLVDFSGTCKVHSKGE